MCEEEKTEIEESARICERDREGKRDRIRELKTGKEKQKGVCFRGCVCVNDGKHVSPLSHKQEWGALHRALDRHTAVSVI